MSFLVRFIITYLTFHILSFHHRPQRHWWSRWELHPRPDSLLTNVSSASWLFISLLLIHSVKLREKVFILFPHSTPITGFIYPNGNRSLITSRGCPVGCTFCAVHGGKKIRYQSSERMVSDYRDLVEKYDGKIQEINICHYSIIVFWLF